VLRQLISFIHFSIPGRAEHFFCFPEAPDLFSCSPTGNGGRFAVGSCNFRLASGLRKCEAILPAPAIRHGVQRDDFNFASTVKKAFLFVTKFAQFYAIIAPRCYGQDPASERFSRSTSSLN